MQRCLAGGGQTSPGRLHLCSGCRLKAYFDSIPHSPLLEDIGQYIADGRVLGLLEAFLKQDILEGLRQWTAEQGSPQGAGISPLRANLYLHPVDVAMAKEGTR